MHSCEVSVCGAGGGVGGAGEEGGALLLELSRLIVRSRAPAPRPDGAGETSRHREEGRGGVGVDAAAVGEAVERAQRALLVDNQLKSHVQALLTERVPLCIDVLLTPNCAPCSHANIGETLLLERWTLALKNKLSETRPASLMTSQWLLNAVRSQLHFSQISAWRAKLHQPPEPQERQRRRSRETCNYKKLESNCDAQELSGGDTRDSKESRLNIVYRARSTRDAQEFSRTATAHRFPLADITSQLYLEVVLECLPRTEEIPVVRCGCALSKRRPSRDASAAPPPACPAPPEDLAGRLNDLTLGPARASLARLPEYLKDPYRDLAGSVRLDHPYSSLQRDVSANYVLVDDRMHTPCSESGKHRCSCDDESDAGRHDERRLRDLAKHKRRARKEIRLRRISSSESNEPTTSIPILQAARFDRMRALGCYRARSHAPAVPADRVAKRTASVGTQTEESAARCGCGRPLDSECAACRGRLVRSEASYDLARASRRRERDRSAEQAMKKLKCDTECATQVVKRPKLRRALAHRIQRVVSDRGRIDPGGAAAGAAGHSARSESSSSLDSCGWEGRPDNSDDMDELLLRDDDSVFAHVGPASPSSPSASTPSPPASPPSPPSPPAPTASRADGEVVLCDYGTFDTYSDSPKRKPASDTSRRVPSALATAGFRYRLDSAACMVFHARTGLPLTSSPAPLRRHTNHFDYDDTIRKPHHIRSALFQPVSPPEGWSSPGSSPGSPAPAVPAAPPPRPAPPRRHTALRMPPPTGLLGSFEESALQGRLEPVATVQGFTAELGASGAFCPPHARLPVTVFFYALGGTNAPYLGHINLGAAGYRVPRSGTVQVSLFNPHGTLVKMFVVLYSLTDMPARARTFLRQRTLHLPADEPCPPHPDLCRRCLRYLIHLRFLTSKTGKLYLHTDIRIIVSRKADIDTAAAHMPMWRAPEGVSYELRSFTYAPDNPKYSPR